MMATVIKGPHKGLTGEIKKTTGSYDGKPVYVLIGGLWIMKKWVEVV